MSTTYIIRTTSEPFLFLSYKFTRERPQQQIAPEMNTNNEQQRINLNSKKKKKKKDMQQFSSMCQHLSKLLKPLVIWVGLQSFTNSFPTHPSRNPVHRNIFELLAPVKVSEMKWKNCQFE